MLQTIKQLFNRNTTEKKLSIALFGLDAAGKTTILYKLKLGEIVTTIPTIGFNVEQVDIDSQHHVTAWDVGGRGKMRALFRHYIENMDAVFFILDSNDKDRMETARYEMTYFSKICLEKNIVLVILANKQDLPNALSTREILLQLELDKHLPRGIKYNIFGCSATTQSANELRKQFSNAIQFVAMCREENKRKKKGIIINKTTNQKQSDDTKSSTIFKTLSAIGKAIISVF